MTEEVEAAGYRYRCGRRQRLAPEDGRDIYGWVPSRALVLLCPDCGEDEPRWGPGEAANLDVQVPPPRAIPEPEASELKRALDELFPD